MRTLLAASGGGHLAELVSLRPRLPFDTGKVTWFTPDSQQSRSMLAGQDVLHAHRAPPRDWRAAMRNARLAAELVRRHRFDAVVSTGASIAVSTLPVARWLGARAYYVESAARVLGPSVSGRILALAPGVRTFCQFESWASARWPFAGSVFDSFEPGPDRRVAKLDRVVVTLGSQDGYPFDRLVSRLVAVLPEQAEVSWQTGATQVGSYGINGVASMPYAQLETAIAAADLVVAHAGVGSALSALRAGRHPVLVARQRSFGEHVDDHQIQIGTELERRGLATICAPEELDSDVLLEAARRSVVTVEAPRALALPT